MTGVVDKCLRRLYVLMDPVAAYAADAGKFSLLHAGLLNQRSCTLLLINGMEEVLNQLQDASLFTLGEKDNTSAIPRSSCGRRGWSCHQRNYADILRFKAKMLLQILRRQERT